MTRLFEGNDKGLTECKKKEAMGVGEASSWRDHAIQLFNG
jgi:hypothetical protein